MKLEEINVAIHQLTDLDQIECVIHAAKMRREWLGRQQKWSLRVGATVSFTGRHGMKEIGTVQKINQKKVIVRVNGTNWNVPAAMLRVEEGNGQTV